MVRHGSIATRLARATAADVAENPSGIAEITSRGEKYTQHMIETDILRALTGQSGPALFPNIRGAVKDLMSAAKMSKWTAQGSIMAGMGEDLPGFYATYESGPPAQPVPGLTTSLTQTPTAPSGGDFDWGKLASSIIGAGATIGTAVYTSQITADTAKRQAQLAAQAAAARQTTAMYSGSSQAGVLGGSGGTILLIGGIAVLGIGAFMALSGGGKKSGRRRRR